MVIGGATLFEEGGISPVPVIVGIGLFVLVLFAAWERWGRIRRGREPLVRLSILRLLPIRVGVMLTAGPCSWPWLASCFACRSFSR